MATRARKIVIKRRKLIGLLSRREVENLFDEEKRPWAWDLKTLIENAVAGWDDDTEVAVRKWFSEALEK